MTPAYEIHAYETHAYEMHAYEVHAHEVYPYEMHAHETHSYEIQALEMHARKVWGEISRSPTLQIVVRWLVCRDLSCKIVLAQVSAWAAAISRSSALAPARPMYTFVAPL